MVCPGNFHSKAILPTCVAKTSKTCTGPNCKSWLNQWSRFHAKTESMILWRRTSSHSHCSQTLSTCVATKPAKHAQTKDKHQNCAGKRSVERIYWQGVKSMLEGGHSKASCPPSPSMRIIRVDTHLKHRLNTCKSIRSLLLVASHTQFWQTTFNIYFINVCSGMCMLWWFCSSISWLRLRAIRAWWRSWTFCRASRSSIAISWTRFEMSWVPETRLWRLWRFSFSSPNGFEYMVRGSSWHAKFDSLLNTEVRDAFAFWQ